MGDKEKQYLALQLQNLEKQRKFLHDAIDNYIDKVLSASKTCLERCIDSRQLYRDIDSIIQTSVTFLMQKCTEISQLQQPEILALKQELIENTIQTDNDQEKAAKQITSQCTVVTKAIQDRISHTKCQKKDHILTNEINSFEMQQSGKPKVKTSNPVRHEKEAKKITQELTKDIEEVPESYLDQPLCESRNDTGSTLNQDSVMLSTSRDTETILKKKSYKCDVCEREFLTKPRLSAHRRGHFYELKYKCQECGRTYSFESHYEIHMLTHTGEKPHKCQICNKAFQLRHQLTEHSKLHSGDKSFYHCDLCGKSFTRKFNLHKHNRIHLKDNPYRCYVCGHDFSTSSDLHRHLMLHTGERPFRCDICDEGFTRKRYLIRHKRKHTGERPFKCAECGKCFTCKSTLDVHVKIHRPETPYLCDHCGRSFKIQSSLLAHKRSHIIATTEKQFKCAICGKGFTTNHLLSIHKRTHLEEKPFGCEKCSKSFREKCQLVAHLTTHSEERPFGCDACGKSFKKEVQLCRHKETHREGTPFKCDVCGKAFKIKYSMLAHKRKMHLKKGKGMPSNTNAISGASSPDNPICSKNSPTSNTALKIVRYYAEEFQEHSETDDRQQESGQGSSKEEFKSFNHNYSTTLENEAERLSSHNLQDSNRKRSSDVHQLKSNSSESTSYETNFKLPTQSAYEPILSLVENNHKSSNSGTHNDLDSVMAVPSYFALGPAAPLPWSY